MHYLALVWNSSVFETNCEARALLRRFLERSPRWNMVLDAQGLAVCCEIPVDSSFNQVYALQKQRGVVLGRLFDRDYADSNGTHERVPKPVIFTEECTHDIVSTGGSYLLQSYWGHYVAFLNDTDRGTAQVLRDPSGYVPCQWTDMKGIRIYFNRLEDRERLEPLRASVNSHFLLGYLVFGIASTHETGFNEVETVLPGERITHRFKATTREFLWDPLKISESAIIEDPEEAADALHRTVRACIHAWASCFNKIVLRLSGGLDSSIVASCLADAPSRPEVICRNLYSLDSGSDERGFARIVAQRMGFELVEQHANFGFSFASLEDYPNTPFPFPWSAYDRDGSLEENIAIRDQQIDAYFDGIGGDELFVTHTPLPTVIDHCSRHGISRQTLSVALDDAIGNRVSLWRVLRVLNYHGLRKRPWHMRNAFAGATRAMISAEKIREARSDKSLWHPLYRSAPKSGIVKFSQAYLLTAGTASFHMPALVESTAVGISVLKSQPIMELSLRIPLYVLRHGGQDRAIARRAFAGDVPKEVILRKTKAYANAQIEAIFARNIGMVRELLLDGFLVRNGFIDRKQLETKLSGQLSRSAASILELALYFDVEAWIQTR